jgi:GMP synthase (glutamine-hydrolysing)
VRLFPCGSIKEGIRELRIVSTLVVKNIANEGPGLIEAHLFASKTIYHIAEPAPSIDSLPSYDTLIIMGGPMGVYEADSYKEVRVSLSLIEQALKQGKQVLGICLGAQMMAHVLGAKVYKGSQQETGWMDIALTAQGEKDKAFSALGNSADRIPVFHWHGDTFDIPPGAVHLAGSDMYPNQAFRYGDNAYALQFHLEVTNEIVASWFAGKEETHQLQEPQYIEYLSRSNDFFGRLLN